MAETPKRIQRKRTKGWKMPQNTVYVGRPSRWGNCFLSNAYAERAHAVDDYRNWIESIPASVAAAKALLRGKNLACWCPLDQPCHADVLLEIANR